MNRQPSARELVEAVSRWLGEAGDGEARAFEAKVARNALAIVARELELGSAAEARAVERLALLVGRSGSVDALEAALCTLIRERRIALDHPGLLAHLRATTLDRIAIDQPNYRHALAKETGT